MTHRPRHELLDTGFGDDDGAADPELRRRLQVVGEGADQRASALDALTGARLLVPVVAVPGDVESDEVEMAAVLLTGRDGRRALLAFTGLDSLVRWRADARPVPVSARAAAAAAVEEGAGALVVDVAGPTTYAVEGSDLRGLARGWRLARVGSEHAWLEPAHEAASPPAGAPEGPVGVPTTE